MRTKLSAVDHVLVRVGALDDADTRTFDVRVAGVAALMVAKLHKIAERKGSPDRLQDKGGLDVLRLLRFAETMHLAGTLAKLAEHDRMWRNTQALQRAPREGPRARPGATWARPIVV